MPNEPQDTDDPLAPLLTAAFAAHEGTVEARGESVVAQLRLSRGIQATPLAFGTPTPGESAEADEHQLRTSNGARYQILDEIGRGGLGLVMRGQDVDLRREVALKVLRARLADRKDLIERFLLEAQLGGQLEHPGIAPVYDLGITADGRPFFIMKLVQGSTLAELLEEERHGERGDAIHLLGIFSQICKAVGYAHARGVVHRDLKPANVMVGEFGEVQVVDWGLAKVAGLPDEPVQDDRVPAPDLSAEPQSRPGTIVGTPGYMAPEQARGETAEAASDVYALGVMLLELLAERPLAMELPGRVGFQRVRGLLDGHDLAMQRLVAACLAWDPKARPQDALEVGRRIDAHLTRTDERAHEAQVRAAGEEARADEAARRLVAESRARRGTLIAAAVVLIAVLVGAGTWTRVTGLASQRELAASLEIEESLGRAASKQSEARASEQLGGWAEALEAARGALAVATVQSVDPSLEDRARTTVESLEKQLEAAQDEERRKELGDSLREGLLHLNDRSTQLSTPREHYAELQEMLAAYGTPLEARVPPELQSRLERDGLLGLAIQTLDALGTKARSWAKKLEDPRTTMFEAISPEDIAFGDGWVTFWNLAQALDRDRVRLRLREYALTDDATHVWETAEALLTSRGTDASTINLAASILHGNDMRDEALRVWKHGARTVPGDFWIRYRLANALFKGGKDTSEAIAHAEAATALAPESSPGWTTLGVLLGRAGRAEEALPVLERALRLGPDVGINHSNLATALGALKRFDEQLDAIDQWLEVQPGYGFALKMRVKVHARLMDPQGLRNDLEALWDLRTGPGVFTPLDEEEVEWMLVEGNYWRTLCEPEKARRAFEAALTINPEFPEGLINLGRLLMDDFGEYDRGLELMKRGHELGTQQESWNFPSEKWLGVAGRKAAMAKLYGERGTKIDEPENAQDAGLFAEVLFAEEDFNAYLVVLGKLQKSGKKGWQFYSRIGKTTYLHWAIASVKHAATPQAASHSRAAFLRAAARTLELDARSLPTMPGDLSPEKSVIHRLVHPAFASVRGEEALQQLDPETADAWRKAWTALDETRQKLRAQSK